MATMFTRKRLNITFTLTMPVLFLMPSYFSSLSSFHFLSAYKPRVHFHVWNSTQIPFIICFRFSWRRSR